MKILFLIRSLHCGGAERQMILLARGLRQRGHDVLIATFYSGGGLERELREAQIPLRPLHKRGRWDVLPFLWRLIRIVREERPEILHGYLPDPNLVAVAVKFIFPNIRIVWGVRSASVDLKWYGWFARMSFRLSCWLSRFADSIIVNSHAGREYHLATGYPAEKTLVIPNGIDTERFRPERLGRCRLRAEWGVRETEKLVGLVGRLDPMKDHPVFLDAASLLAKHRDDVRFVCVGEGAREYQDRLQALTRCLGLERQMVWAGPCDDMLSVYNSLDIHVNTSYGEGLSNVIGEAMACGVPCVVTNVGDSAWIVGEHGLVVPPKNPIALAKAMEHLLAGQAFSPDQVRQQIVRKLSVNSLIDKTEHHLEGLLQGAASRDIESRAMSEVVGK